MQAPSSESTISPRWLTLEAGSKYVGVHVRTLQNWMNAGAFRVANVIAPGATRGRRLIDRESLDNYIESFVGAGPAAIVMNAGRKLKEVKP